MLIFDGTIFLALKKYFPSRNYARMRDYSNFKARFISRSSLGNDAALGDGKPDFFRALADCNAY